MAYQPPISGKRISIKADNDPAIETGEVTLAAGDNITLEQSGSTITINSSGGDGGGGSGAAAPSGTVSIFAGSAAPSGWLLCDGSAVSHETYADLFAVIGTTYGNGDGSTTFNLPNLKGRVPVGLDSGQTEFDALGETGGEKEHQLTIGEMPSHTHTQNAHTHTQNSHNHTQNPHTHVLNRVGWQGDDGHADSLHFFKIINNSPGGPSGMSSVTATNNATTATNQNTTATNQNTGGDEAHNNLQPYVVMHYIIKT